jgi:hypothetical protein
VSGKYVGWVMYCVVAVVVRFFGFLKDVYEIKEGGHDHVGIGTIRMVALGSRV